MSLASLADVAARLRRDLTTEEQSWVPDLIDEASAIVSGYLGVDLGETGVVGGDGVSDAVPAAVRIVVSRMVARAMRQADTSAAPVAGVESMGRTMGPFTEQWKLRDGAGSGSPWLENVDRITLKRYRVGGGMTSVPLAGDHGGRWGGL